MLAVPEWLLLIMGKLFLGILALSALLIILGAALLLINAYRDRFFLPRVTIMLFSSFRYPIKALLRLAGVPGTNIDHLSLDIRNAVQRPFFAAVPPGRRLVFLPQCLRDGSCPAKTSAEEGILCVRCGRCVIARFVQRGKELGYQGVFVVPGSSFIKRIVKRDAPGAVLGVACTHDAMAGMELLEAYGLPAQSIVLAKEGCVDTVVDADAVLEIMDLGTEGQGAHGADASPERAGTAA